MNHLKEKYKKEVVPQMMKEFGYKTPLAVPCLKKIVVSCGFGKEIIGLSSSERDKFINNVFETLALITGQKPILKRARISISSFKLRKGMPVGAMVTLRRERMFDFLEKLIKVVLPRSKDFRGIPLKSLDKNGNLSLGFKEYVPFPEVTPEKERAIFGLEITIVTNARDRKKGERLLRLIGLPLQASNEADAEKEK